MEARKWLSLSLVGLAMLMLSGCQGAPDWKAMYSESLGQPVDDINETALNSDFMDEQGNLTRVTTARLADGSTALLGLPAHANPPETVVERTVPLFQDEWQTACKQAVLQQPDVQAEEESWGISWGGVEGAVGNTFQAYPDFDMTGGGSRDLYCEFAYLPGGWELRVVRVVGTIKSEQ